MAAASNSIGSFSLIRQVKPRGRWGASTVPVYDPNWIVEFRLPGEKPRKESSRLPLCELCMKSAENPVKARPGCRVANCQGDVQRWAAARLDELAAQWKAGRLTGRRAAAAERVTLEQVRALYAQTGPGDRMKNLRALEMVTCEVLGKSWEDICVDELHPDLWDRFAWMYQEADRRGWLNRDGKKPADALAQLRRACPEHPMPDREAATAANGTIRSTMRKAKSVLGQESQDSYLKPLRDKMPVDGSFVRWLHTKVSVRTLDHRFDVAPEVYAAMWESLPALKVDDPQVWALIRLHWTTGVRPIEAAAARTTWLEQDPATGAVLLVVRNRPGEGFSLKDRDSKQARPWPLPADLLELLPRLAVPGGSLFGCRTPGQWDAIYRRANAWLRGCGLEGQHTLYHLRKLVATVVMQREGLEAAAHALGHRHSTTTAEYYAGQSGAITALSDAELNPTAVMGARRVPWTMTTL